VNEHGHTTAPDPRDEPPTPSERFVGAARVVAAVTLLSRVFGLARDAVCSRVFGAGPVWSAFAFAFLLPNLARRLFGEGALTGAFIPEYSRLLHQDPPAAHRYATAMLRLTAGVLTIAAALVEIVLILLLELSPLGVSGRLALLLSIALLPFAPMICVTALLGGVLQTHGRFAPTAAAPVILNVCIIAGVLGWKLAGGEELETAAFAAAFGVLAAGLLQIAWSFAAARREARWTFKGPDPSSAVRATLRRTAPVVLGMGALQINTLLDGVIASWPVLVGPTVSLPLAGTVDYPLDGAANAALFFASRLYQFPLGVFGLAVATAVFPLLARQASDPDAFDATLSDGLRLSLFIGLPATFGLVLVAGDLTAAIYAGGLFDAASVDRVSLVLAAYAVGVWAYIANHTLTRAFYAVGDTRTPMRVTLGMVAVNLALNVTLIWFLAEAGLALSTALCAIAQLALLAHAWQRRGRPVGGDVARSFFWSLGLAVAMSLAVLAALAGLAALETRAPDLLPGSWAAGAVRLALAVVVGIAVYGGLAALTGRPELRLLLERTRPDARGELGRGREPGEG